MSAEAPNARVLHSPAWRKARWLVGAGIIGAFAVVLYLAFFHNWGHLGPDTSRDPRVDYSGPFLNVNPTVEYVADERCAQCHADKARTFALHPMGRSLMPISRADSPPAGAKENNPFEAHGFRFLVERNHDQS